MAIKERKVIYSVEIEYGYAKREEGFRLISDSREREFSVEKLEKQVREIILDQLPTDLHKIFGINVKVEGLTTRYGSLVFFFAAIFTGFNIITNYKSFYDSVQLLKKHCDRFINSLLTQNYKGELEANVNIEYPTLSEPKYEILSRLFRRRERFYHEFGEEFPDVYPSELTTIRTQRRDGFFYFLLVLSIVSLMIIGVLVYGAMVKTFFP